MFSTSLWSVAKNSTLENPEVCKDPPMSTNEDVINLLPHRQPAIAREVARLASQRYKSYNTSMEEDHCKQSLWKMHPCVSSAKYPNPKDFCQNVASLNSLLLKIIFWKSVMARSYCIHFAGIYLT